MLLIRKVECKMNPKKYVLWGIEKVLRSISNDMLDKIGWSAAIVTMSIGIWMCIVKFRTLM